MSREAGRFSRSLSFLVLASKIGRAIVRWKESSAASPNSSKEKRTLMSATAPASDIDVTKTSKRDMLDNLVKQNRTVEVPTDDTLDRALEPDAFKEVFERKVNGLSGFSAPFQRRSTAK
jgi:hypothetical protein